jgi:hypothetical protein
MNKILGSKTEILTYQEDGESYTVMSFISFILHHMLLE